MPPISEPILTGRSLEMLPPRECEQPHATALLHAPPPAVHRRSGGPIAVSESYRRRSVSRAPTIGVSRLLKSCATPPGQLSECFELRHFVNTRRCFGKARLVAQALRYIMNEFICPDLPTLASRRTIELHLVMTPVTARIAELGSFGEFLATQRPRPDGPRVIPGCFRQMVEGFEQRHADPGPDAEHPLETRPSRPC